jgi:hypothetical protein
VTEFVWRWLKETGGGGYLRFVFNPNKREQDGFQERILCGDCEGLFSSWEKEFSERVFVPMHRDGVSVVQYGPWLGKLCVSVCWRTLFVFHQMGSLHHFSDDLRTSAESALTAWRDYLLDQAKTPAPFDIHLLPLEPIQSTSVTDMPPNMNRYLLRAVDLEVVCSARSAFVYCKLCQTALFGFIKMPEASAWIGTGISYGEDTIAPLDIPQLPGYIPATGLWTQGGVNVPGGATFTGSLLFPLPAGTPTADPQLQFFANGQTRIVSLAPCRSGACPPVLG